MGAPCSGKSTYIREHAKSGDVIIDLDRLALAISVEGTLDHDYPKHIRHVALGARAGGLTRALRLSGCDVWIIQTQPSPKQFAAYRARGIQIIRVDPGLNICLERAARLRPHITPVIRAFYEGTLKPAFGEMFEFA